MVTILFFIGLGWLAYVYVAYPLLVSIAGFLWPFRATHDNSFVPSVSVLISARNEEKDIEWKVRETLAWEYPKDKLQVLVASDASDDRTDVILGRISDSRLKFVRLEQRSGKQRALNHLESMAGGELLMFTDANTHISNDILRKMVRYFADSRVGCVTGVEQTIASEDSSAVESGGRAYLNYESWVNVAESRLGSVLVCDGSIFAMRKSLFSPLDPEVANDLESPVRVGGQGKAILYDPCLRSMERSTTSLSQDFNRRRRICAQGVLGMWRLKSVLRGLRLWQFVSRKFLRWLGLVPLAMLLVAIPLLPSSLWSRALLACEAIFVACALIGAFFTLSNRNPGLCFSAPLYFVVAQVAAFMGIVDTVLGRRFGVWEQPTLSRGTSDRVVKSGAL